MRPITDMTAVRVLTASGETYRGTLGDFERLNQLSDDEACGLRCALYLHGIYVKHAPHAHLVEVVTPEINQQLRDHVANRNEPGIHSA